MIKNFRPKTCAFDCEWVPCAETARRLLKLAPDTTEADAFEAIWDYSRKAGDDTPQPFIKLVLSRVISVAAVFRTYDQDADQTKLLLLGRGVGCGYDTEAEMIQTFLEGVAKGSYQLWGFNSRGSDLPILVQRGMTLGAVCPEFTRRDKKRDYFYPYGDDHIDIMHALMGSRGSASPKLDELAAASCIPGKLGTSGDQVAQMYLAGKLDEIVAYNECDALTTHLLMLQVARYAGKLDAEGYEREIQAVHDLLAREISRGKVHLQEFREQWNAWQGQAAYVALAF